MKEPTENQEKIIKYYSGIGSRLGYDYVLWGSMHLGYYPSGQENIGEKKAQELLQDLVAKNLDLKETMTVLDAGCGQGVVSTYLAKKYGAKIFGINITPFHLKKAKKLAKRLGVRDRVTYELMDYSSTNFPEKYFDGVYVTEALSHSPDIFKTLKEFIRILKPGGKFAFFEYIIAPDEKFSDQEKKMLYLVIERSAMMALKHFRFGEFPKILESIGFENVKEQNITENLRPSFTRIHKLSILPYFFVKLFGLQKYFVNITAGYEYYKMADKGLIQYRIFTGNRPIK